MIDAEEIKRRLNLIPLEREGGFYHETYRATETLTTAGGTRSTMTAIYYLLTPETCSRLHRLKSDEIYHFYLGDPVELLMLAPEGATKLILGRDLERCMHVQACVPKDTWQGARLVEGGHFALLGTTVSPGFDFADFALGEREALIARYPRLSEDIVRLTSPS